jgi:biopolymer transport protein ExbB
MHDSPLGIAHFLVQADAVARFILVTMLLASLATWGIIVDRLVAHWLQRRRGALFLSRFRHIHAFDDLERELAGCGENACTRLARLAVESARHFAAYGDAGGREEFLTRALRQGIEEEAERLERGLTLLASVGSTAPFVGLFGTVWGIYHALIAIGLSGQGTLDKVAGPVGEALIMTAVGLAVAIPAVLGYNALARRNRVVLGRLDALGHDLLTLALTGVPLRRGAPASPQRVARAA